MRKLNTVHSSGLGRIMSIASAALASIGKPDLVRSTKDLDMTATGHQLRQQGHTNVSQGDRSTMTTTDQIGQQHRSTPAFAKSTETIFQGFRDTLSFGRSLIDTLRRTVNRDSISGSWAKPAFALAS